MMAGSPAIRIATQGGGKAPDAAPASGRSGFPAAMVAATSGGPRPAPGGAAAAAGETAPAGRDAREAAEDPGIAAVLATLFPANPVAVTPPSGEGAGAESLELEDLSGLGEQGEDLLQTADGMADALAVQPEADLDAAAEAEDQLLRNLAKELSLAREGAGALRASVDARAPTGIDAPAGSAASHAATQLPALASTTTVAQATAAAAAEQAALRSPVGSPRWAEELGSRLVMMSTRGQNEGSLSLAPEHLGPLEVRISMNQQTANVWFGAHHPDTRAALAEALPRLREMLADAGLSLGQSGVSHEAPRQEHSQSASLHVDESVAGSVTPLAAAPRALSGLLDLYA